MARNPELDSITVECGCGFKLTVPWYQGPTLHADFRRIHPPATCPKVLAAIKNAA